MHKRQAAKVEALTAITEGDKSYKTFSRAASFGFIRPEEFVRIDDYKPGQRWAQDFETGKDHFNKDHSFSRHAAFNSTQQLWNSMSLPLVCAMMNHARKYELGPIPDKNTALWLMAVIAGHPANAAMMSAKQNSQKGAQCSITLPQLCDKICRWELS